MSAYRLAKNLILRGRTTGMEEKLNAFLLFNQVSQDEYTELMGMLKQELGGDTTAEPVM